MYEEEIHTSLTSELDAREWLVSCLATKVSQTVNLFCQTWCTHEVTERAEPMLIEIR